MLFYKKSYECSLLDLQSISDSIQQECIKFKFSSRETHTALLLLEEIGVCLAHKDSNTKFYVSFEKRWVNYYLNISTIDNEFNNPLNLINDYNEEDVEESARHSIFSAYKNSLSFTRSGNKNIVSAKVHEMGNKFVFYTFFAMILGILTGLILKRVCTENVASVVSNIFDVVPTLFINALKLMLAPLVFCSIETSISGLTDVSKFGRMAFKILMMYLVTSILCLFLGYGLASLLFKNGASFALSGAVTSSEALSTFDTIRNTIIGIIPSNLISPIVNGDMLQVIFVGILIGICSNSLGDRVKPLNDLIEAVNVLCMKIVNVVMKFLPLSCFCSMLTSLLNTGLNSLLSLLVLIIALYIGIVFIILIYILMICVFGKISPKPFVKKIIPYLLTPFSLSSSAACVPMTTDVCINKLGIDEKLTYFAIPLGATVNMNGSCCYLIMASYLFLKAAGIPMTFGIWLNIFVTVLLLAIGSPGVPGGAIINMTTIFSIVGVPSSAVALVTSINQFVDMGCTSVNVFGDIACTTIVAAKDNLLNKDIYNG